MQQWHSARFSISNHSDMSVTMGILVILISRYIDADSYAFVKQAHSETETMEIRGRDLDSTPFCEVGRLAVRWRPTTVYPPEPCVLVRSGSTESTDVPLPLQLQFEPEYRRAESVVFRWLPSLFSGDVREQINRHFLNITQEVSNNPKIPVNDIRMLDERELHQIHSEFSISGPLTDDSSTCLDYFMHHVQTNPDRIMVQFEGNTWTYHSVNLWADTIAANPKEFQV